jgi:hypothetical protein
MVVQRVAAAERIDLAVAPGRRVAAIMTAGTIA